MPVISVTLLPGYPKDVQERLVQRIAIAARSVISAAPAGTTVFVNEASTYQRDSQVFTSGGSSRPIASDLVLSFFNFNARKKFRPSQRVFGTEFFYVFSYGCAHDPIA